MLYSVSVSLVPLVLRWWVFLALMRIRNATMRAYRWMRDKVLQGKAYNHRYIGWRRGEVGLTILVSADTSYSSRVQLEVHVGAHHWAFNLSPRARYHRTVAPYGWVSTSGQRWIEIEWPTLKISHSVWSVMGCVWSRLTRAERAQVRTERRDPNWRPF